MNERREMHPSLRHLDHRPWPLPEARWGWRQAWLDLAFIHYRVDAAQLRARLPRRLTIQEFDGSAWVGVVPFRMAGVMRRPWPDLPGFSAFPELNVRTYVEFGGKPGVWFFSLDAASWPVVLGGRFVYRLPYFRARMKHAMEADRACVFSSARLGAPVEFEARYRAVGAPAFAVKGTFAHWAAERYCLYSAAGADALARVEVHHGPWPLHEAEVDISRNDLFAAAGLRVPEQRPVCHFSAGVEVVSFPVERLG